MKMFTKIFYSVFNTNSFPILGGATGAATQIGKLTSAMPAWETFIAAMIISFAGAIVGLATKVVWDWLAKCIKNRK